MKVSIMQPYMFPYMGYFQLINAVDKFVFYDDVNFTKRSWINRNNILINGKKTLISFPCIKQSQNKKINEIEVDLNNKGYKKILNSIEMAYANAPFFNEVFPVVESVINCGAKNIAELAATSLVETCKYLGIEKEFTFSSQNFQHTQGFGRAERLVEITKELGGTNYINSIGGIDLYEKDFFAERDVELQFLKPVFEDYEQFGSEFHQGLSIIDVMMFNSRKSIKRMLDNYQLL